VTVDDKGKSVYFDRNKPENKNRPIKKKVSLTNLELLIMRMKEYNLFY